MKFLTPQHVLTLLCISLLTACGGGGGSSGGSSQPGGGDNNTSKVLKLSNANNMYYLGVLHGKRTDDSTFTSIDTATASITPTNSDGYVSLAVHCYSGDGTAEVTVYDLQVKGEREIDLRCRQHQLGEYKEFQFTGNHGNQFYSAMISGDGVHSWVTTAEDMIGLNAADQKSTYIYNSLKFQYPENDTETRTFWSFYFTGQYNEQPTGAQLNIKETTFDSIKDPNYSNPDQYGLPFNQYANGNHALTLLDTPASSYYSLDYYSPSRFTYPLRTSTKIGDNTSAAALINADLKATDDYYIEHFVSSEGHTYRHVSTTPKGAELFGADGTYKGATASAAVDFVLENDGSMTYKQPTGIESSLSLKGREVEIHYDTGVSGEGMYFNYYSELADSIVLASSYEQALGNFDDLPADLKSQLELFDEMALDHNYVSSKKIRFFYSNNVTGNGQVTLVTKDF